MTTTTLDISKLHLSLDEVLARLVPLTAPEAARIPGLHSGSMEATDDFDATLPDDFWLGQP